MSETSWFGTVSRVPFSRELSENDRSTMKKVFYDCDVECKGYLSREDTKVAFVSLFGYKPSKCEVDKVFEKWGKPSCSEGCLELEPYMAVMSEKFSTLDEDEQIRQTFIAFDSQCRGFLTVEDLKKVFKQIAPNITDQTVESTFREADRDGDGRVSYKDFEFMMKYQYDGI